MKNFGIFILGLIIGLIAMYFYCQATSKDFYDENLDDPSKPIGLISPEEAKVLDRDYNPRYRLISDSIVTRKGGDNRSSWYALDELKKYLSYAESQAIDFGYTMNGVRIYLGAYPNEGDEPGYTTMFFVPTGIKNKSRGALFNHSFQGGLGSPDIPEGDVLNQGGAGRPPGANYPQ